LTVSDTSNDNVSPLTIVTFAVMVGSVVAATHAEPLYVSHVGTALQRLPVGKPATDRKSPATCATAVVDIATRSTASKRNCSLCFIYTSMHNERTSCARGAHNSVCVMIDVWKIYFIKINFLVSMNEPACILQK